MRLRVRTFQIGMLGMLISLFLNFPLRLLDVHSPMPLADALLAAIVFATLPGEFVKLFTIRYYCQRLISFRSVPSGMVYGGIAALGFTLADIIVFAAPQLSFVSPLRTLIAIPLHVATGALIGFGLAQQMFVRNSWWTLRKAWGLGAISHGLFNFLWLYAGLARYAGSAHWIVSYGLPILGTCIALSVCVWAATALRRYSERRVVQSMPDDDAGRSIDESFFRRLRAVAQEKDTDSLQ